MVFANQCPGTWLPGRAKYDSPVSPIAGSPSYAGGGPAKTGCSEVEADAVIEVLLAATVVFRDRAHEGRDDTPLDAALVSTICQQLDGMPLAIELAAARTRSLPLDRIVAELAHVFRVLTRGARTAVARHQAARWVGRSLPLIMRGVTAFVGLLRGLTLGQPSELDTVRAWFDDMGESPTCRSQLVMPMISEYLARGEFADAHTVAASFKRTADTPLHRALCHQIDAIIAYSERDHEACGAACSNLIGLASTHNCALLTIDGFELLSLSNTESAEYAVTLLGAVHAARDDTGYRGRWPSYATNTLDATNAAVQNYPTAFRQGTTMTLEHLVPFIGPHTPHEA